MNNLYIEYRDPLFGIIVFFSLVFFISLTSYWWGRYKNSSDKEEMDNFFKKFHTLPNDDELKNLLQLEDISFKSWILLSNAFFQNSEYEKTIEIYQHLLLQDIDINDKRDIMLLLGKTYYKAGFLERSKQIFLEILRKMPRTTDALKYLLLVYDQLKDYKSAMDVIEPLVELDCNVDNELLYLALMLIINDTKLSQNEKEKKVAEFYQVNKVLSYTVLSYLFKSNVKLAWSLLDQSQCEKIMDILYNIKDEDLDLDIISNNKFLRELYTAKGSLNLEESSDIFELDILIKLDKNVANLTFEYMCRDCKITQPFVFHRCSNCHSIDTLESVPVLSKAYDKEQYFSF